MLSEVEVGEGVRIGGKGGKLSAEEYKCVQDTNCHIFHYLLQNSIFRKSLNFSLDNS